MMFWFSCSDSTEFNLNLEINANCGSNPSLCPCPDDKRCPKSNKLQNINVWWPLLSLSLSLFSLPFLVPPINTKEDGKAGKSANEKKRDGIIAGVILALVLIAIAVLCVTIFVVTLWVFYCTPSGYMEVSIDVNMPFTCCILGTYAKVLLTRRKNFWMNPRMALWINLRASCTTILSLQTLKLT